MATLLGADGQPLRATRPPNTDYQLGSWFTTPLVSNTWSDRTELDGLPLVSYDRLYRSQPALSAVIDKLARRVATLPFGPFTLVPSNGSREPLLNGPLYDLLRSPWPRATALALNHHVMIGLLVHGNALVAMLRGDGQDNPPTGLWRLDWSHIGAYGRQGGPVEWWSTVQFGNELFIRPEDVLHFAWGDPCGTDIGVSPLEKLGVTLRLEAAAQTHQSSMFANGSRPSLAVALEHDNPKRELLDYARERVEAMHKGPANAGRTFFMGANVKVQPLSLTPVEAELIEQRRLNWDEIGMVFDLAGPLRGDLSHGTMANVEEMLKSMYRDVIPPWTELLIQTYQSQMLDPHDEWRDYSVGFDFADKLKGEPAEQANRLKLLVEAGLYSRNEARRELGMPPDSDPNADILTVPTNNMASISALSTSSAPAQPSGTAADAAPAVAVSDQQPSSPPA